MAERFLGHVEPLRRVGVTDGRVDEAAKLKTRFAISFADVFAMTPAHEVHVSLVTADLEILSTVEGGGVTGEWPQR